MEVEVGCATHQSSVSQLLACLSIMDNNDEPLPQDNIENLSDNIAKVHHSFILNISKRTRELKLTVSTKNIFFVF